MNLRSPLLDNLAIIRHFLSLPAMFSTATSEFGPPVAWAALRKTAAHGLPPHGRILVTIARDDRDGNGGLAPTIVICGPA